MPIAHEHGLGGEPPPKVKLHWEYQDLTVGVVSNISGCRRAKRPQRRWPRIALAHLGVRSAMRLSRHKVQILKFMLKKTQFTFASWPMGDPCLLGKIDQLQQARGALRVTRKRAGKYGCKRGLLSLWQSQMLISKPIKACSGDLSHPLSRPQSRPLAGHD